MFETGEARAAILARIRDVKPGAGKLRDGQNDAAASWGEIQREYKAAPDLPRAEILLLMEDRLVDYDAQVFHCQPSEIFSCVGRALQQRSKHNIGVPEGVPDEWLPAGFSFAKDRDLSFDDVDALDGILTAATLAIADTGTIVLQNAAGQGRRAATLIPDYHLCVLLASQVVQSVPEAMQLLNATSTLPTTMISGPSATADIEMTRIKGVHGPRFLDVILVDDSLRDFAMSGTG